MWYNTRFRYSWHRYPNSHPSQSILNRFTGLLFIFPLSNVYFNIILLMCLFFEKTLVSDKILIFSSNFLFWRPKTIKICVSRSIQATQGRSEGTSSVAFEVLIINCQIYFINLFIFNCLKLNIKLFIFKLFDVKFLFSENHVFHKQKRTAVYGLMDVRL